jgi:hypothetical protein
MNRIFITLCLFLIGCSSPKMSHPSKVIEIHTDFNAAKQHLLEAGAVEEDIIELSLATEPKITHPTFRLPDGRWYLIDINSDTGKIRGIWQYQKTSPNNPINVIHVDRITIEN